MFPCLQAREAREREEASLDYKRRTLDIEEGYRDKLSALRREKEQLEEELKKQVREGGGQWGGGGRVQVTKKVTAQQVWRAGGTGGGGSAQAGLAGSGKAGKQCILSE